MRTLPVFAPALYLPLLVRAQMGSGTGAVYIPSEDFGAATYGNPNATGSFPIDGFDVTKPYPSGSAPDPIEGWSIELGVAAAISTENSTGTMSLPNDGYAAGLSLQLKPPAELVTQDAAGVKADESWKVCITVMFNDQFSEAATEAGKKDDGSCNMLFGEECVAALLAAWESEAVKSNDGRICPTPKRPAECSGASEQDLFSSMGTALLEFHSDPKDGDQNAVQIGSGYFKDKTNTTEYDLLGGKPFPVVIGWGFNSTSRRAPGTMVYAGASLACVRATKAAPGSELPFASAKEEDEDNDQQNQSPGNNNGSGNEDNKNDSPGYRTRWSVLI
ncbi:hypothetical protein V8F20_011988 [Naviculisporaceae sp. PSN 640]